MALTAQLIGRAAGPNDYGRHSSTVGTSDNRAVLCVHECQLAPRGDLPGSSRHPKPPRSTAPSGSEDAGLMTEVLTVVAIWALRQPSVFRMGAVCARRRRAVKSRA